MTALHSDYPWVKPNAPIVVSAPMLKIALAQLAVSVSAAGGIGFLSGGLDLSEFPQHLAEAAELVRSNNVPVHAGLLPIGVGFLSWGASLELAIPALQNVPCGSGMVFRTLPALRSPRMG